MSKMSSWGANFLMARSTFAREVQVATISSVGATSSTRERIRAKISGESSAIMVRSGGIVVNIDL